MIPVFIGYDPREAVAWSVLAYSIQVRSSVPVTIAPLMQQQLRDVLSRERHALQSTEFSFSRFLTPYLSQYTGWSIFLDCDMLALDDIARLWSLRDERFAVQVVKHRHLPREKTKFLGQAQSTYEKKNWSSVMLFNNRKCGALTPEYVNCASGLDLHQFKWLEREDLVGELPGRWNHLVDYCARSRDVSLVHFTLGGPYFPEFADCEYAEEWRAEREAMLFAGHR
ncbi:MAG: glycosyltransferase [Betaproteobacteria bacterium]|nr:glycosyltransferase [Betaproteobacteria bacterium]